ncbi:MAG: AMP-binding protein [Alphaproteobacteria bacterium]|nr:AMP-binding protein [Alphaproteobacteria bacterium]MCB9931737.1 AMP-binding protein [Alphaproteobacteria bacterium]
MASSPWIAAYERLEQSVPRRKPLLAGPRPLTYGDLFAGVRKTAALCANLGLKPGDRVIVITEDDRSLIMLFLSFLRLGLTTIVLDPHAPLSEAESLMRASDALGLFADASYLSQHALDRSEGAPQITVRIDGAATETQGKSKIGRLFGRQSARAAETYPACLSALEEGPLPGDLTDEALAYILFTSGTTSRPKGVEITHNNLFAQEQTFVRQYGFDEKVNLLNLLPMHHTDGLTHGAVLAFHAGATLHRPQPLRVDTLEPILRSIYTLQITHFITVPTILGLMGNLIDDCGDCLRTGDFRFIISTAAFLDPAIWTRIESGYNVSVVNVYGLTETVCEALYCGPTPDTRKVGTVGKPVDCEARIVDDEGKEVAPGSVGELVLRGDHIMRGYFRAPAETAEVLKDGWFHTGDLAALDEDGFYRIVGRKKNVIIVGGINVYPEDVTSVLRTIPGVQDAVTFGMPDPIWGERLTCCLEVPDGTLLTSADVATHCAQKMAREKIPGTVHFMPELPRGPAGKVLIEAVREEIRNAHARAAETNDNSDILGAVAQVAAEFFKCPVADITPPSNPDTLSGWTSLAHIEFLTAIEDRFSIKLRPREIMNVAKIGDVIELVERKMKPAG